jgi:hypothetical protein
MAPVAQPHATAPARAAWVAAAAHGEPARSRRHHPCPAPSHSSCSIRSSRSSTSCRPPAGASRAAPPRLAVPTTQVTARPRSGDTGAAGDGRGSTLDPHPPGQDARRTGQERHRSQAVPPAGSTWGCKDRGVPPSARQPTRSKPACRTPVLPHSDPKHGVRGRTGTAADIGPLAGRSMRPWRPGQIPECTLVWVDKATTAWFEALKRLGRFNMISSAATAAGLAPAPSGHRRRRAIQAHQSVRSKGAA